MKNNKYKYDPNDVYTAIYPEQHESKNTNLCTSKKYSIYYLHIEISYTNSAGTQFKTEAVYLLHNVTIQDDGLMGGPFLRL